MTARRVPRLHLIGPLDGVLPPEKYPEVARRAAEGGVDAVHVRLPGAAGGEVYRLGRGVVDGLNNPPGTVLCINDRVDVAMLLSAGGIHLGERSLGVAHVRELMGSDVLIGRSVHDLHGAFRAQSDGADYILAGHVFATGSKPGQPGRGVEWIAELTGTVDIPVIAIGGINLERIEDVINAGAWGVALGRELLTANDPAAVAAAMREKIEQK